MLTKEEWGNATWYLFHTLAFKLKEEFSNLIPNLINFIKITCNELPCPDCKEHATKYIKYYNINNVKNRNDLIEYLNKFHNSVNLNLQKPEMSIETSNELYNRAKTDYIIRNYIQIIKKPTGNMNFMMNTFSRQTTLATFIKFININRHAFN